MIAEYLLKNSALITSLMAMNTGSKKLALTLAIMAILLSLAMVNMKPVRAESTVGGNIDLYTQKNPYSGEGPNVTSDAFGPGEEVQIYARVTYNDYPVQKLLVGFQISGPPNPVENISLYRAASTDDLGLATTSFRVSHLNETTFGKWTVIGNTGIASSIYTDTLTFEVGWIVEIVSIKTTNENHVEQEEFTRGSHIGIELGVQNIAMTEKIATLTVTICDYLGTYVNATELSDFVVPPNRTLVYTYFSLYIPRTAYVGNATVYACAYTALPSSNGVPYCPEVSKSFLVSPMKYFLEVRTDPAHIVTIAGEGWYEENADVGLTAPQTILVSEGVRYEFSYWDINGLSRGSGVNLITVQMNASQTATAHYILILTFTLTIETAAGGTTDPQPGAYSYNANSTVQTRALPSANFAFNHWELDGVDVSSANPIGVKMDKNHTLKAVFSSAPSGWFIPEWFYWFSLLLLLILLGILLFAFWYRRRKRSEAEFYSGWTAWYYGYDLRSKTRKQSPKRARAENN
jgi:hypothetical protein